MKKIKLLVDMDQILVDMVPTWLKLYNKETENDENVSFKDIVEYDVNKFVKYPLVLESILNKQGFFYDMPPMPDAIKYLNLIITDDLANVRIVTQPPRNGNYGIVDKKAWLQNHLPVYDITNTHFCHRKDDIHGDVLFDDAPKHLVSWKKAFPQGKLVTVDYAYNRHVEVDHRLHKEEAWKKLYELLKSESL